MPINRKHSCDSSWRYSCVAAAIIDTLAVTNQGPTVMAPGDIAITAVEHMAMVVAAASEA